MREGLLPLDLKRSVTSQVGLAGDLVNARKQTTGGFPVLCRDFERSAAAVAFVLSILASANYDPSLDLANLAVEGPAIRDPATATVRRIS